MMIKFRTSCLVRFYPILSQDTTREERLVKEGFTIFPTFLHPKSNGEIKLKTTDPMDQPLIDPNYFDHPYDVKAMIKVATWKRHFKNNDYHKE